MAAFDAPEGEITDVSYIARLLQAGRKGAICDQVESAAAAPGLVRREITRAITPGTVLDERMLEGKDTNYLVAIAPGRERSGLAALDFSTADFTLLEYPEHDPRALEGHLATFSPSEIVLAESAGPVLERTISRLLDNLGREGTDEIGRLLDEPAMREEVARNVNDAILAFLSRPLAEHVQTLGSERLVSLRDTVVRAIVTALRDEGTRAYAIERLDRALLAAEGRTWGELLEGVPGDQAARWAAAALKSPTARRWIGEVWGGAVRLLLDWPIAVRFWKRLVT